MNEMKVVFLPVRGTIDAMLLLKSMVLRVVLEWTMRMKRIPECWLDQ